MDVSKCVEAIAYEIAPRLWKFLPLQLCAGLWEGQP